MGLRESNGVYLIPSTLFHLPKPKINEKMGDLPKLAWSCDVTGKVDNIHSNLTLVMVAAQRTRLDQQRRAAWNIPVVLQ